MIRFIFPVAEPIANVSRSPSCSTWPPGRRTKIGPMEDDLPWEPDLRDLCFSIDLDDWIEKEATLHFMYAIRVVMQLLVAVVVTVRKLKVSGIIWNLQLGLCFEDIARLGRAWKHKLTLRVNLSTNLGILVTRLITRAPAQRWARRRVSKYGYEKEMGAQ